ncbi:MAG: Gfo/Idh/MocA family oxidoreductase [Kiritimatiellae bacterium]|nr:Gfo/Idh/MocA family oxidoreductase [Kiritimatiellia bacterium]
MKKAGFIDISIDSYHPNKCIAGLRSGKYKDKIDVGFAYEEKKGGGRSIDKWCEDNKVKKMTSPQEIVNAADAIAVFAPDNPERHFELAEYALKSGKPTFIDKTFAADVKTAKEIVALAEQYKTPIFSASAFRFADEIWNWNANYRGTNRVTFVSTRGAEEWPRYSIHQIEMVIPMIGVGVKRVMQVGKNNVVALALDYGDDRSGVINCIKTNSKYGLNQGFEINAVFGTEMALSKQLTSGTVFNRLAEAQAEFFIAGKEPVPHEEIIEGIRIIDAGNKAIQKPYTWIEVEQ